jgi:hypothetical protein
MCICMCAHLNISMTRQQQRIQQRIYDHLHSRLDQGPYQDNREHNLRLAYELGLMIGLISRMAAEDSRIREDLYRLLGPDQS